MFFLKIIIIYSLLSGFVFRYWTCNLCSVSFFPPRDPELIAPERGCAVWGESRAMEAQHSCNWNGSFLNQEDDLCSHRSPRPDWMMNMEKTVRSNTLWCVHGVRFHWPVHFLLFLLACYFHSTSLRQGSDMLIVKILFLHRECAELDKDGCAVRASW